MFATKPATIMLPAKDVERAKQWYAEKLDLHPTQSDQYGARYKLNGADNVFLYQTQYAGTAEHILISFATDDILRDMEQLRARGVTFLDYDLPGMKTVDGLATFGPIKNAWAKDSEGNILGFVQGM